MSMNERFLTRLNMISGWILAILLILYILSGYGMTKGIMNPDLAKKLHNQWLAIPLFLSFVVHLAISSRYALVRWKIFENIKSTNIYVFVLSIIFLILFLWLYFL